MFHITAMTFESYIKVKYVKYVLQFITLLFVSFVDGGVHIKYNDCLRRVYYNKYLDHQVV